MQTELPDGASSVVGLISHRPHFHHRYAPYPLHRPHLQTVTMPYLHSHPQQRIPSLSPTASTISIQRPKTSRSPTPTPPEGTHIGHLYPEILTMIFSKLTVRDRGRAAQVCSAWRDAAYSKSVWKGVEARLHLKRSQPQLFASLQKRGIRKIQILSLRKSIKHVISSVSNLETLNLSGCYNVTDNNLCDAIHSELPNLKVLDLSLCKQITDTSLGRISQNLKNLEILELGGCCNITNTSLLLIAFGLKNLKRLNLRSCWHITDQGIGFLAGLSKDKTTISPETLKLTYLGLQDCQRLTDESLKYIAQGLPTLESINLSFCVSITDSGLKHLARMPQLEELNLRSCDNISDIGMAYLTEGGCTVTSLDVSFCDKIGDQALSHLSQGLFHLKSLSLNHCQITDDGLTRIAKSLHDLETLNIGQCSKVTDKGLQSLTEYLHNLIAIDLYGCTQLSAQGLDAIMKLPKLAKVNLGLWLVR